jgi:hypothetical protein
MIREQEDEQEQLDDHTDLFTQEEYLSDDDHHRSRSRLRRNTCSSSTQAMGNKRGPDAVRRGEKLHPNERFKSAISSAKKNLVNNSPMIATTTEFKQGAAPGDKDKNKNHGPEAEPKTAGAEGEENHSRNLNATDLTSQIYDADEGDFKDGEHDAYHSNDKAEEDANVSKKHSKKDAPSTTFPQHLMDVIELESQHAKPNILEWVEVNGGDAFLIRNKEAFEQNIVPKYFSRGLTKCKFMSFARKLYRYVPFQPTLPFLCKHTFALCCVFCSYHHLVPAITLDGVSVKFLRSHYPAAIMVQV